MFGGNGLRGLAGMDRSVGGIPRNFGLQNREIGEVSGAVARLERALLQRVARLLLIPHWRAWIVIFGCVIVSAALGVLPPLAIRGILDNAIPHANYPLLFWLVGAVVALSIVSGLVGVLQN